MKQFQNAVWRWMLECFGNRIPHNRRERCFRFYEEAGELVQALGMTKEEAHALVDYTWERPPGQYEQEVGGVMVTLAALVNAHTSALKYDDDIELMADIELERCWQNIEKIRAKQAAKKIRDGALP